MISHTADENMSMDTLPILEVQLHQQFSNQVVFRFGDGPMVYSVQETGSLFVRH